MAELRRDAIFYCPCMGAINQS